MSGSVICDICHQPFLLFGILPGTDHDQVLVEPMGPDARAECPTCAPPGLVRGYRIETKKRGRTS